MKESFWGTAVVVMGLMAIFFLYFFQSITNTDEHNYHLLKEATESAMYDAIDLAYYRAHGTLSKTYKIEIYDVNETPPKVSLKVSSTESTTVTGEVMDFDITNKIDAILETPY